MLFKVCLSFHVFNFWELQLVLLQFIFYSILLLLHLWYTFSNFCEDLIYLKSSAFCIASASLKFYLTTCVFIFLPCWRLLSSCWLYYTLIFEWHMHPHTHIHTHTHTHTHTLSQTDWKICEWCSLIESHETILTHMDQAILFR